MKHITAILLVMILFVGFVAYRDMDERFRAVGDEICSIVGQDSTMSAYYQMPNIDIKDYPVTLDMGTMTPAEQKAFHDILMAAENGESMVPYEPGISMEKILTHLELYYGTEKDFWQLFCWTTTHIILRLDVFESCEQRKVTVDARVDELLATLKEGSDQFKLFQISAYLAERIVYTDGARESVEGLNGNGVCSTYAMLFYKAASRLGIQTYLCYGYAGGGAHAWNMVVLDGEEYFYDVTWFDNEVYDFRYLHSPTSWDRDFVLNNAWWDTSGSE